MEKSFITSGPDHLDESILSFNISGDLGISSCKQPV